MTPQYVVVHILMYIALSIVFAYLWVNLAGLSAEDQARTMVTSGLSIPGFRTSARSLAMHLRRYVNSLTFTSGLLAGLIAALGDVLGVYGTGIGLILLVEIIIQYYTIAMQEQLFEAYPGLKRILGVE
jgi:protein translocase subunit secY/sec61 alpha